jgi:hypothetical protein
MSNWNFGVPPFPVSLLPTRRKVFISYCHRDQQEAVNFIARWNNVFIPRALGVAYTDDIINSTNPEYVMSQIREKYLGDSTVTIVLVGTCTHSRRYVDWEIKTTLRQGMNYVPNGLLAFLLPSARLQDGYVFTLTKAQYPHLPNRLDLNYRPNDAQTYARYYFMPTTDEEMRASIEDAFTARTARPCSIVNPSDMMKYNASCKLCGVTH